MEAGQQFSVTFPFFIEEYIGYSEEGPFKDDTWIPGCRAIDCDPYGPEFVADGEGAMILTVVDVHKPGKYPERVFYTRKFVDPYGKEFGNGKLHITTTAAFKRRAAGYYHAYRIADESGDNQ